MCLFFLNSADSWVARIAGIKEFSDWPTIPQLYVGKEFVGGCDIVMGMHQSGELAKLLEEKGVLVPVEEEDGEAKKGT